MCGSGVGLRGLLGALAREADDRGYRDVVVHTRVGGEMEVLARRLGGRVSIAHQRSGGGMGRILDWARYVKELAPLWAAAPGADLTIATVLGGVRVLAGRAEVTDTAPDIRLPQDLLLQGLVGYLGGADLLEDARVEVLRPAAVPAFVRLLSRRAPYFWAPDEF